MTYSLVRVSDGAGDSGSMSTIFYIGEDDNIKYEQNTKPRIGASIKVGSLYSRTYSLQDYWSTTPVTEILEEKEDYIRFKTKNSEYEWKVF